MSLRSNWSKQLVLGQSTLHSETLSPRVEKIKINTKETKMMSYNLYTKITTCCTTYIFMNERFL